jgi:rare lipoprotein A
MLLLCSIPALATTPPPESPEAKQEAQKLAQLPPVTPRGHLDQSGRKQKGHASYYAKKFTNRKMADGNRFNPNSNVAASKTLPLGTTAKVTNLRNGKSAMVTVEDRGPHVDGRVVDLTPKVADELEMKKSGVAPVVVAPVTVPQPDGAVKLGAGAAEASPQEVENATRQTAATLR